MNEQMNTGEIVIYQTEGGQTSLEVKLIEDTVWLNLNQMAGLFQRNKSVVSRHYNMSEFVFSPWAEVEEKLSGL